MGEYECERLGCICGKGEVKRIEEKIERMESHSYRRCGKKVEVLQEELAGWDIKGEESILSPAELERRKLCMAELIRAKKLKSSMMWQKAKIRWLKEGDANSRYFHSWVNRRRRSNEILCLSVGEKEVVQVEEIRKTVREHFRSHFSKSLENRPELTHLDFHVLGHNENEFLIAPFSVDEIKEAVWSCDSSKSPGPDGFNFGFIKDFWEIMKDDVVAFIRSFIAMGG